MNNRQENEMWMTLDELAQRWRVSRATIYNRISRHDPGLPRFARLSGRIRFVKSDVERIEREALAASAQ